MTIDELKLLVRFVKIIKNKGSPVPRESVN